MHIYMCYVVFFFSENPTFFLLKKRIVALLFLLSFTAWNRIGVILVIILLYNYYLYNTLYTNCYYSSEYTRIIVIRLKYGHCTATHSDC